MADLDIRVAHRQTRWPIMGFPTLQAAVAQERLRVGRLVGASLVDQVIIDPPFNAFFFDDFNYTVGRNDADKSAFITQGGWHGIKDGGGTSFLYTVPSIPGFGGTFPAGSGTRALCMEARPTLGGQTDFYLKLGNTSSAAFEDFLPGNIWFQFWLYPQNHEPSGQLSRRSQRNKFLYVSRDPNGYGSHLHNWHIGDSGAASNPHGGIWPWGGPPSSFQGEFTWFMGSLVGGTNLIYDDPDLGQDDSVAPQIIDEYFVPNRWTLSKMHFDTNGPNGIWQAWLRPQGGDWIQIADWEGGVTPNFTWEIPAAQRGGHRELRMPTTVGDTNPNGVHWDYWLYMQDFCIAEDESGLPVY